MSASWMKNEAKPVELTGDSGLSSRAQELRLAQFITVRGAKTMNIRFTSSLTPEDENLIAPALIRAFTSFLDLMPIAYVVRIDTSDSRVYQHSGPEGYPEAVGEPARPRVGARSSATGRGHS